MATNENDKFDSTEFIRKHKQKILGYPDMKKLAEDVDAMQNLPLASIKIHLIEALSMLFIIQAAIARDPEIANDGFAKIGIAAAKRIQLELFSQKTETHKALEFGWNPEANIAASPELILSMFEEIQQEIQDKGENVEGNKNEKNKDLQQDQIMFDGEFNDLIVRFTQQP